MKRRSLWPWWLALLGSLILHASLLGGLTWTLPQWSAPDEPQPFDAELVLGPAPAAPLQISPRALPADAPPEPRRSIELRPARPAQASPVATVVAPAETAPESESLAETESNEAAVPGAAVPTTETSGLDSDESARPTLNALPPRLDLRFQVSYGLASGVQTLQWVNEGERYTAISVAEATGLAGMFYRGRFVQTSRGRITPGGLQPEDFWDQRGDRRSSARFDPALGRLTLTPPTGAVRHFNYAGAVQDVVSIFFQLALAPPSTGRQTFKVFNGKKLRDYTYVVRGEEALETALGTQRSLHLARENDADGRFEIWLAMDRHYLPLRVLRSDDKGNVVELKLKSMAP